MELRQLTYFLTAAQTQNFRKAAEICLVAQPALSRQIAALEDELGVELFRRVKQRVVLTPAGQEFAAYVRDALDHLQQGQQAMARLQDGEHGTIHIGSIEPLTTVFLPTIFPIFHQRYPNIQLKVRVSRTDDLLRLIEHGELDLGLIFNPNVHPEVLVVKELFRQPLQIMVAADHPLAQHKTVPVTLAQILQEPLFLLGETSRLRRAVDRAFTARRITIQPVVEIESLAGLKELVRQGRGITFMLPALLYSSEIDREVVLLPIEDLSEEFVFALVYPRFRRIAQPARHFINTIMDTLAATQEEE
ncbi:LysR family transcriptional regulator [Dictyobacter sp. S3.2.2.5]|uniref:LysR family transcriptional regulator n=1 Tax=Dictyobacter halimunensis TaxID=3026934 RepID=A0ABQ6FMK0_9CHLR|nr:LysR family transcriptional regulator [Dictyobacter sp. S3.2.2.5]GLV54879.1 LysR family transcriptional regulator [Dictyobacter sp. S3.2.2.5]